MKRSHWSAYALAFALAFALAAGLPWPTSIAEARPRPSLTDSNRRMITEFARIFYTERDVKKAFEAYVSDHYVQHNPNIADGREAAIAALAPKFSAPGARFDIRRIVVDGNLAVIHLRGRPSPDALGGAVADIYRIENGKIVEHWDVLQAIPAKSVNANGVI